MDQERLNEMQINVALINQTLSRIPNLESELTKLNNRLFWYNGAIAIIGVIFPIVLSGIIYVGNSWRESKDNNDIQLQHQISAIENRVLKLEMVMGNEKIH